MARLRKINGSYYAYFYDRDRSPKEKSWPLRVRQQSAARRKLTPLEKGYKTGEFDPWNGGWQSEAVTVSESVERFLRAKQGTVRPATQDTYRQQLEALLQTLPRGGDIDLDRLQGADLQRYVFSFATKGGADANPPSNATQRKRYRHVRVWLNWCVKQGYIDRSPLDDLSKPKKETKEPAYLKPADVDRLLIAIDHHRDTTTDAVGRTPDVQWLRDVIQVAVATGLRRGELAALRWADVDLDDGRIHVRHRGDFKTKGNAERRVPLVGDALDTLRRMDEDRTDDLDGPVFVDRRGLPVRPDRMTKRFKTMAGVAGLDERVRFHSLRHTCGAWLSMKGVPMRIIQAILGHSSISVTERYSHLAPETLDQAMQQTFSQ